MSEFHINGDGFGCYAHIKTDFPERVHVYKVVGFFESNGYCDVPIRYDTEPYLHKEVVPVANVIHCGVDESKVIRVAIADCEKIEYRIAEKNNAIVNQLADFILSNSHFCPIPVEMKCECGFKQKGCKECLIKHAHLLSRPKED